MVDKKEPQTLPDKLDIAIEKVILETTEPLMNFDEKIRSIPSVEGLIEYREIGINAMLFAPDKLQEEFLLAINKEISLRLSQQQND
ncbi:MAG: hypothetical protein PHQ41_08470 [Candidatus Cloacimonetes bacterium]|nr:hypothetical protein [Candidatus Cloacimonadota bacterium]